MAMTHQCAIAGRCFGSAVPPQCDGLAEPQVAGFRFELTDEGVIPRRASRFEAILEAAAQAGTVIRGCVL